MTLFRSIALVLGVALVAAPALAQQRVYKSTSTAGVNQYSDTRPEGQYSARNLDTPRPVPATTAATAPEESAQCKGVRSNLARLQSNESVGIDSNGDGTPDRNLSADERKSQIELNQAAVKTYCPPAQG